MEGKRETVRAKLSERIFIKPVSPKLLHVNPEDEFSIPDVGPNLSIIENYSMIAIRNREMRRPVFPEPINVCKLRNHEYMILNGHHRWAGAMKARVPKVNIIISDF